MIIPSLTTIHVLWSPGAFPNERLKVVLENSFHRREVACDGNLGHKIVSYINPGIDYNLTIFKVHHEEKILVSGNVRIPTASEYMLVEYNSSYRHNKLGWAPQVTCGGLGHFVSLASLTHTPS